MSNLTEISIIDAFLKELHDKPFDKITVKSLSEKCGINRKTFYNHFGGTDSLLNGALARGRAKALGIFLQSAPLGERSSRIAEFLLEKRRLISNIWHSEERPLLEDCVFETAETAMLSYIRAKAGSGFTDKTVSALAHFYAFALLGIIGRWMRSGMPDSLGATLAAFGSVLDSSLLPTLKSLENV